MFQMPMEIFHRAFNSFKVLLERTRSVFVGVNVAYLSILLKSYWNQNSRRVIPLSTLSFNSFKVLLEHLAGCSLPCRSSTLSILLKSYWNGRKLRTSFRKCSISFNSFKVLLERLIPQLRSMKS